MLIVGAGETKDVELVDRLLYREMRAHGIGIEILPTYQACETFNLLNSERRCIAAALIPPGNIASNAHEHFIEPAIDKLLYAWKPDPTFNPDTGVGANHELSSVQMISVRVTIASHEMPMINHFPRVCWLTQKISHTLSRRHECSMLEETGHSNRHICISVTAQPYKYTCTESAVIVHIDHC